MKRKNLIIYCLYSAFIFLVATSCTYDYFEDETNYIVHVPEVADKTASNCQVLIYDGTGKLVAQKSANAPYDTNPRIAKGDFAFNLPPGDFKVYCYTDTDCVKFSDVNTLSGSKFCLSEIEGSEDGGSVGPSVMYFSIMKSTIVFPAPVKTDTVELSPYVGKIVIRFKNEAMLANIIVDKAEITARGVGTQQYLEKDTLTCHRVDYSYAVSMADKKVTDEGKVEFESYFFPSIENESIDLQIRFMNGAEPSSFGLLEMQALDKTTGVPLCLLAGKKIIIEIDSMFIWTMEIVDWDGDVQGGDVIIM